ncbi:CBF domain-containing protein [Haematococcus lacustris]|uniref:CBF domain-containing protein n=1 Tax=Haematococcus lacustris TaxID=44745 RepID=A0A699ZND6_HAELA|nr:CBF domain-containing protein [Haematococcus lacustris]
MLANEAASFEREMQKRNAADYKWLQQVKRQGTTADKVAAITLQVQESAVANLAGLDMLLGWVTRRQGGREVVRQALEALQELFLTVLLPDGRRLKHLESQPLASLPSGKEGAKYLLWWFLEDQIKVRYGLFVGALEECSRDNLEFLKDKATKALYTLLVKKPEAEARLLGALVNKLGDPARKLASKAGYLLSQLLLQHPVMKPVVLREESEGGASLAGKLVGLYFTLFRMVVEGSIGLAAATRKLQVAAMNVCGYAAGTTAGMGMKDRERQRPVKPPKKPDLAVPEEMDARLLSALITGIRRAFPFVAPEEVEPLVEANCQRLFTLMHTAPFPVAVQALMLMWQLMSSKSAVTDRFYRALYSVMSNEAALTSSKAPMFLSLLFKAMRVDVSTKRCAAFSKRLLQTAVLAPPAFACGSLLLVSEVLKAQPALEPQFAGAERSCWWELAALAAHSHPSVAAMARTLLAGQCVVYDGDPLKDMALAAFLDKFIAKKPKAVVKAAALYCLQAQARGASLMQPITAADPELHPQTELGSVGSPRPSSAGPGSEAFAALAESQVQPDEVFFHRFYTLQTVKARRAAAKTAKAAKRAKQGKGSDDDASSDDGEELGSEAEIDAMDLATIMSLPSPSSSEASLLDSPATGSG